MKNLTISFIATLLFVGFSLTDMKGQLTMPANSPEAEVTQRVGITDITIHYSRPYVKGREIWGALVPYGFNDLGFGTSKSAPWRAGADYNTTIAFTHDVTIDGRKVPAGKYGLFMAPEESGEVMIILSSNTSSWGSYYYDVKEDVLRFKVTSKETANNTEMLTYSFDTADATSATASLKWEKKEIPFKIEVDVKEIVIANIKNDLRNPTGFEQSTWDEAASYAYNAGELDQALEWVNGSIEGNFFSKENFSNLSLKSQILKKKGMNTEADAILAKAIPLGGASELYRLGSSFLNDGNNDKALEIMLTNVKNNEGAFPSNYGVAKAYSAKKDFKNAMQHLENALKAAPAAYQSRFTGELERLKKGEDFTQPAK